MSALENIHTRRLVLRLMNDAVMAACIAREFDQAERLLGVRVPLELLDHPTSLQ